MSAEAESQVTSLWQVDDAATRDLMVYYYTRLQKGEGRGEALRNAQLSMLKSSQRSHPILLGEFHSNRRLGRLAEDLRRSVTR